MSGNKRLPAAALAGGLVALAVLAGCAGEPSVASKSAAAFLEAQKKGETFEGAEHSHGHGAITPGGDAPEAAPSGHDHGEAGAAPDHSAMEHGGGAHVAPPAAVPAGQPAATLRPDALDAPAATSVLDAQRSAEMAEEMRGGGGHGGHGSHGAGTYHHVDAGRGPGAYQGSEKQTPGAGSHQHNHGSATAPPGQEGDHSGHEPPGGAAQDAAAVYACPMHPEVTSATPGKCPKCGMDLVKRRKG